MTQCWTTTNVNMRNQPSIAGTVIRVLPANTPCTFAGRQDGWIKVDHNDRRGFISEQYVTFEEPKTSTKPQWLVQAEKYLGLKEVQGPQHNPKILEWWKTTGQSYKDDETSWCAAFVGGVLEETNITSSKSAAARSYLNWGQKLAKPAVGSIVTFWRGSPTGWQGHVGFVVGQDSKGNIMVLGGNQENAVNIKPFSTARVLGYTWPKDQPLPTSYQLPQVKSDGRVSTNEA